MYTTIVGSVWGVFETSGTCMRVWRLCGRAEHRWKKATHLAEYPSICALRRQVYSIRVTYFQTLMIRAAIGRDRSVHVRTHHVQPKAHTSCACPAPGHHTCPTRVLRLHCTRPLCPAHPAQPFYMCRTPDIHHNCACLGHVLRMPYVCPSLKSLTAPAPANLLFNADIPECLQNWRPWGPAQGLPHALPCGEPHELMLVQPNCRAQPNS